MTIAPSPTLANAPRSSGLTVALKRDDRSEVTLAALDTASDDVRRLAAEIDSILSSNRARTSGTARSAPVRDTSFALVAPDESDDSAFAWAAEAASVSPPPEAAKFGAARAHSWLAKARRERRVSRIRGMLAWTLTLIVGGLIIAAASYLIFGIIPDVDLLTKIGTRAAL